VDEVVWFIKDADPQALGPHVDLFRKHVSLTDTFIYKWQTNTMCWTCYQI